MTRLAQRLLCWLGDHAESYRETREGHRCLICSACGRVVRSVAVVPGAQPSHEGMKARPKNAARLRVAK